MHLIEYETSSVVHFAPLKCHFIDLHKVKQKMVTTWAKTFEWLTKTEKYEEFFGL